APPSIRELKRRQRRARLTAPFSPFFIHADYGTVSDSNIVCSYLFTFPQSAHCWCETANRWNRVSANRSAAERGVHAASASAPPSLRELKRRERRAPLRLSVQRTPSHRSEPACDTERESKPGVHEVRNFCRASEGNCFQVHQARP